MSGSDDVPPPPPPPTPQTQPQPQHVPHTMSTVKLPILKKGEYDIWAMKMEHYLAHTDYPIWEVIQKGNGPVSITTDTQGIIKVLPPRTAEEILARERERKARTTLLMALPEDHLAKFHKMTDAKEMWDAIKSRFGGNDESKKMQKYILKQQFEGFTISNSEGLHKGYDRFQSLLSQLEIHGAGVSTEDANQKFLRSLPSSWSQVSLIMRTKPGIDDLSFDDLYNNLRVFEYDIKGSNTSSSSSPNVAFVSSESTNSTNNVSTASGVSPSSSHNSKRETSSSYTDDLMTPRLNATTAIKQDTLQENVDQKEVKMQGGEIQEAMDSDDECVATPLSEQEQSRETVHEHTTSSQSPKVKKKDLNGSKFTKMGLGYGCTRKGCYVCGSFTHLIKDCDFHEKRMAKKAEMNKRVSKSTNQRDNRPIWNNDDPQRALKNKGIVDSGCSRHMTGNKGYLVDYQDYNGGPIAFGGSKGQITGKGKIRTGKLDFDDVCFVKELQQFNLFSVSQMCDKKKTRYLH
ncbi:hypothetical protein Tco_1010475 [Tanacetum coccineum]